MWSDPTQMTTPGLIHYCPDTECPHQFPHTHTNDGVAIPGAPQWHTHWHEFVTTIEGRLDVGEKEYGDTSFTSPPAETIREITEELLDVVGWSYILWCKLKRLAPPP